MRAFMALLFSVLLLSTVVVATHSDDTDEIPITIDGVEIDDTEVRPFGLNQLDIERDQDFEVELELFAHDDIDDVEIRAFISGFEFTDVQPIAAVIGPFQFDENVTFKRSLTLRLPDDVETDDYKLRIIVSDRDHDEFIQNFDLQINTPRHHMIIEDVVFSPGFTVEAGRALLTTVRVENKGQRDEDDVKVTVSVPALGISGADFIEEVEEDEEEETEEIFIRLPRCAEPGVYDVTFDVRYNEGRSRVSDRQQITVLENPDCEEEEELVVVQQQPQQNRTVEQPVDENAGIRTALEVVLLVLVALLVVVGLIIGFMRMQNE